MIGLFNYPLSLVQRDSSSQALIDAERSEHISEAGHGSNHMRHLASV